MDFAERLDLVKQVGEEILTEEELKELLKAKQHPIAYDGFEPSGNVHIAQGIMRAININKLTKTGIQFKMLVADWHGWANNKMGGDLEKIRTVGRYMIEIWKAAGMDTNHVQFVWADEFVTDREYWKKVMQIARHSTVARIIRCAQIMGRSESDQLQASQILYPCMQAADIFHLQADIAQLGMDQRKVNVLARELGPKIGYNKPVVISHHMLAGLGQPPKTTQTTERAIEMKMSKSKPESAIFMTDSEAAIHEKLSKAYCPAKVIEENPVLEYCKYLIFESFDKLEIERPAKFGGVQRFDSYSELEHHYREGQVHPQDLKKAVAVHINELLAPVREHFAKNAKARELLQQVQQFQVTR